MDDPRMKYVPLLREEDFQSMAAVPILSRAGETIGVIVLHTKAPHEFGEDTLKLLVHIASLVSGAIENAQLYDRQRRRVDALTGLSELAQQVAAATDRRRARAGPRRAASARCSGREVCQLFRGRVRAGAGCSLLASSRSAPAPPGDRSRPRADVGRARRPRRPAGRPGAVARARRRRSARHAAVRGRRARSGCCAPAAPRPAGPSTPRTSRSPARSRTWPRWRSSAPS